MLDAGNLPLAYGDEGGATIRQALNQATVGTLPDGSITGKKLADGTVTLDKITPDTVWTKDETALQNTLNLYGVNTPDEALALLFGKAEIATGFYIGANPYYPAQSGISPPEEKVSIFSVDLGFRPSAVFIYPQLSKNTAHQTPESGPCVYPSNASALLVDGYPLASASYGGASGIIGEITDTGFNANVVTVLSGDNNHRATPALSYLGIKYGYVAFK